MTTAAVADLLLIDSNVLVYSLDPSELPKQRIAIDLLDELRRIGRGSVSVQCISEFFNAVTRKIAQPMSGLDAVQYAQDFASVFTVLDLTSEAVIAGCRAVAESQMSIWDALIWSVARSNDVSIILTEDMPHRTSISGVLYHNPFSSDFDLAALLDQDEGS